MTFRIATTVLGKRGVNEIYAATASNQQTIGRATSTVRHFHFSQCRCQERAGRDPEGVASSAQNAAGKGQPLVQEKKDLLSDWESNPDLTIQKFSELPSKNFGVNQHIIINEEFKEALRQILWKFRAPIRYAFAYGSGVFPQSAQAQTGTSLHPNPPEAITKVQGGNQKVIDFIFGVSFSQHWHSLNLQEHKDHYSGLGYLGSYAVSKIQDSIGAGVYFNPYVTVNGTLIKYGVVNIDTLCKDLSEWNTLYLAGRLQKPVKILRDNPSVRLANQVNLISAVRVALLLLPENFTEQQLYSTIAGISYKGDPRMSVGGDDPKKVANIVKYQLENFRRLYAPLVDNLPNISFNDNRTKNAGWLDDPSVNAKLQQNMDPVTRGHMVRRLPQAFRKKLYFEYQSKFKIPRREFNEMMEQTRDEDPDRIRKREGGPFERRIAEDDDDGGLATEVGQVIEKTIRWPSITQSLKGIFTAGASRSWRYAWEKRAKAKAGAKKEHEEGVLKKEKEHKKEAAAGSAAKGQKSEEQKEQEEMKQKLP
ncbi:Mitochondrial translocator assembly and maintenance protein 41 [Knufia obscura]|uniref:Phosphatidate cytidylyltransferase, mitochondrial n=2 Tax=Knufia TaxID=430999 RepID=A0AAN8I6T9_9EURO|nr:Mitochondrial translocator assembly and maintenance protein 41 [Knufia obscura]KAK5951890.1 Mitochondrial translocator assembly and maintenance protein 41 [Knufia fluminis]